MVWINNKYETASGADDNLTTTGMTASEFNIFMTHIIPSGTVDIDMTFNNDTTAKYSKRVNYNGQSTDATDEDLNNAQLSNNVTVPQFNITIACNFATNNKLFWSKQVRAGTDGAGNPPDRFNFIGKWENTSQITEVDIDNSESGDYAQYSNLSCLGDGGTKTSDLANIQTNSIFETSDTGDHYLWNGTAWVQVA